MWDKRMPITSVFSHPYKPYCRRRLMTWKKKANSFQFIPFHCLGYRTRSNLTISSFLTHLSLTRPYLLSVDGGDRMGREWEMRVREETVEIDREGISGIFSHSHISPSIDCYLMNPGNWREIWQGVGPDVKDFIIYCSFLHPPAQIGGRAVKRIICPQLLCLSSSSLRCQQIVQKEEKRLLIRLHIF